LAWDEPAADTLAEWRDDSRRDITIRHLLSLNAGLEAGPIAGAPTYAAAIAARIQSPPGARFDYGPTPFQIFGEIMRRKLNGDPLAYLQRRILDPIEVTPTYWRRGHDGNPQFSSGAGLVARDWARFGWMVMREGEGNVDSAALAECFRPSPTNPGYGLSWWLLREGLIPPRSIHPIAVDLALVEKYGAIFMSAGAGDQRLYLIPSLRLVIARQAAFRSRRRAGRWSDAVFLRALLEPRPV
jgi:CubicO group peptidase (beta-lactamase class C family)